MIYKGEFSNIENELISVTIGSDGDTVELLLAANPVIITSSSDGLFAPIKADACTIKVLTTSIYHDIYSSTALGTSVLVKNETTGEVLFYGYVTPNIYSLEYEGLDALEIEATSALSSLQYYRYKPIQTIVNWYDLIKLCFTKAGYYKSFYFPDNFNFEKAEELQKPFLKVLYQFEGNFFDNDEELTAWTYKEILEEFCRYMGLSLVVHKAKLYFIDYEYRGSKYYLYNLEDDTVEEVELSDVYTITADSYKESGTTISYDETYNKISIKDNLYEVGEMIPAVMEDLYNQNSDPNKYYESEVEVDGKKYTIINSYFWSNKWNPLVGYGSEPSEITDADINGMASFWQKVDDYKSDEVPSSLNWDAYFTMYNDNGLYNMDARAFCMLLLKEWSDMVCNGGYFIVDMQFKLSGYKLAAGCLKTTDLQYSNSKYSAGFSDTLFPCRLYIGDYWFDGEKWQSKAEYLRKYNKGYYRTNVYVITKSKLPTWYKYKDSDGDWIFTNKAEWEATTSEKESGSYKDANHVYCYDGGSISDADRTYVDEQYYNECILLDRFYLAKRNEVGDKIFDETKSLTNTVSWKMNIEDSSDGIAIKLPDFILNGKLRFEVYGANQLGKMPNYRTDLSNYICRAIHIKKLTFEYKASDKLVDLFDNSVNSDDVIYTNVIDEDYVNEWDDMEIKINSQVDDRITSKSSMLFKLADEDNVLFLTNVYNKAQSQYRLQENNLIQYYYNHYSSPKAILELSTENKLLPYSVIKEKNLNKNFTLDSYEYDVYSDTLNAKLIEY